MRSFDFVKKSMANIYYKKIIWKRLLIVIALLIVGLSMWYTRILAERIAVEERKKVQLWAEAISKKAKLVNYTDKLFMKLRDEERKKVELWVEATKRVTNSDLNTDLTFLTRIITDNTTVPVILTDENKRIKTHKNIDAEIASSPEKLQAELALMEAQYDPIEINYYEQEKDLLFYRNSNLYLELQKVFDDLETSFIAEVVSNSASVPVIYTDESKTKVIDFGNISPELLADSAKIEALIKSMVLENAPIEIHLQENKTNYIFYRDSDLLRQLRFYPFIQLGVIGLFILIAYILFSSARKAEQNQVWVGMAKETAHQLGTPLSSLMAWAEILKTENLPPKYTEELNKDIDRLNVITERFSKIGSSPELENVNVKQLIENSLSYLKPRTSSRINMDVYADNNEIEAKLNIPLFEWVLENLTKNAIDAMEGEGNISFSIEKQDNKVIIDVSDTGKGIPATNRKTVFNPGYTTKKRGWGLGLSLTKRIIENYHNGKIFVKQSELNKGTTFRIILNA
jgi:signal transduction histidine kinase